MCGSSVLTGQRRPHRPPLDLFLLQVLDLFVSSFAETVVQAAVHEAANQQTMQDAKLAHEAAVLEVGAALGCLCAPSVPFAGKALTSGCAGANQLCYRGHRLGSVTFPPTSFDVS